MGSGESHFHVLFIARGKVTRQRPQTTAFQEKGGSAGNRASVVHLTAGPSWPTSVQGVFKRRLLHSRTFLKEFCEKKRSNLKLKIKDFFPPVLSWFCVQILICILQATIGGTSCAQVVNNHKGPSTLWALLSGTLLQTLPDLVTPLKGHSLFPHGCPATWSVPSERFGY